MLRVFSLALFAAAAHAQWDTVCPGAKGGPYSAWNESRCDSGSQSCCPSGFSPSGVGCCPFKNAVCCPGSQFACCPEGSTCKLEAGGGYNVRFACVAPDGSNSTNYATCKAGNMLPLSTTLKNVLYIGDSLSLGMIPFLAASLSDIAFTQHSPAGGDGGAEEALYALRCLDNFLHSPSGMPTKYDLILFNSGMHNGPMFNETYPGQNAPPDNYGVELAAITDKLLAQAAAWGAKLLFATTTQYMCNAISDGCVQNLNNQAKAIMASKGVPVVGVYDAMRSKCGPSPTTCNNAFNMTNGLFCPHANSIACACGWPARSPTPRGSSHPSLSFMPCADSWLATTVVAPAVRALLA